MALLISFQMNLGRGTWNSQKHPDFAVGFQHIACSEQSVLKTMEEITCCIYHCETAATSDQHDNAKNCVLVPSQASVLRARPTSTILVDRKP